MGRGVFFCGAGQPVFPWGGASIPDARTPNHTPNHVDAHTPNHTPVYVDAHNPNPSDALTPNYVETHRPYHSDFALLIILLFLIYCCAHFKS